MGCYQFNIMFCVERDFDKIARAQSIKVSADGALAATLQNEKAFQKVPVLFFGHICRTDNQHLLNLFIIPYHMTHKIFGWFSRYQMRKYI